jgi:hypothetical protein
MLLLLPADELLIADTCGLDSWLGQICLEKSYKYRTFLRNEEERNTVSTALGKGTC